MIVETVHADIAGLYFRSVLLPQAGTYIPQHIHPYDHATYVGSGSVELRIDGLVAGRFQAGQAIFVGSGKLHEFLSLEPMTRLCCVHHTESAIAAQKVQVESCPGV